MKAEPLKDKKKYTLELANKPWGIPQEGERMGTFEVVETCDIASAIKWLKKEIEEIYETRLSYDKIFKRIDNAFYDAIEREEVQE